MKMSTQKKPLESKKFILTVFSVLVLAGILVTAFFTQTIGWPLAVVLSLLSIGLIVIPVGTVLGMTAIDKVATMVGSVSGIFGGKTNDSVPEDDVE